MNKRYRDSYAAMIHMVGTLYQTGIPIVAGTDGPAGFLYQRELELYVQAGIPAPAVLQLATIGAARIMHPRRPTRLDHGREAGRRHPRRRRPDDADQ